jgi:hypothetical protein
MSMLYHVVMEVHIHIVYIVKHVGAGTFLSALDLQNFSTTEKFDPYCH